MSGQYATGEIPADFDPRLRDILEGILDELTLRSGRVPNSPGLAYVEVQDIEPESFTLLPNVAVSTLTDARIAAESIILLMPTTANAAAALATTYITQRQVGKCTVNHANNAQTDKTFRYTVIG